MKKIIKAGATSQTIDVFVADSTSTAGAGLTGLVFNSAGLTCYYRKGAVAAPAALSLVTQTVTGAFTAGGFVEIDATNMPGLYRLDLSDGMLDTVGSVSMMLQGAANMAPLPVELQLVTHDFENLMGTVVDGALTLAESIRLANAVLGGKASGLDGTAPVYRDPADTKNRVVGTTDTYGNRTAVTLDLT